jgi:Ca2+/Na+ antiporter
MLYNVEGRYIVAAIIVVLASVLYIIGIFFPIVNNSVTPVEPQSVFTLYGAVLGYLFGSYEKRQNQKQEIAKEIVKENGSEHAA